MPFVYIQSSSINDEHLAFFQFVGRIIGKALHDQRILEAYFSRGLFPLTISLIVISQIDRFSPPSNVQAHAWQACRSSRSRIY